MLSNQAPPVAIHLILFSSFCLSIQLVVGGLVGIGLIDSGPLTLTMQQVASTTRSKLGPALIVCANAGQLPLPDNSVDLIVTSPPYFALRHYKDGSQTYAGQIGAETTPAEFLEALWAVTAEFRRVLKPTGSFFLNMMDKYNSAASNQNGLGATLQGGSHESNRIGRGRTVDSVPVKSLIGLPWRYALGLLDGQACGQWLLRSDMIWHKTNGMPDPTRDRAQRKHEYLFHFTKRSQYYSDPEFVGAAQSVLSLPTEALRTPPHMTVKHPAPFPLGIPSQLIQGWCPPGGVVLDGFGGSGTTALAARAQGRVGISVDLSLDYGKLASWRCDDPTQLGKAQIK